MKISGTFYKTQAVKNVKVVLGYLFIKWSGLILD